jgi:glycine dehydrogenase subunit 1
LARSVTKRDKVAVSDGLHPRYIEVLKTYAWASNFEVDVLSNVQLNTLPGDYAAVVVAQPDFWGNVSEFATLSKAAHDQGALMIVSVNPISLMKLGPPAAYGTDIVVGEGQPLGIPLSMGGPAVGIFATKKEYLRFIPGRIVGQTVDCEGKPGFVLTMQTREQHIRREKATSNICTNQGLMALRATIYLSLLGVNGLREVAERSMTQTRKLMLGLQQIEGVRLLNKGPVFHEFVVELPISARLFQRALNERQVMGGLDVSQFYVDRPNQMLFCCTELTSDQDIECMLEATGKICKKKVLEVAL